MTGDRRIKRLSMEFNTLKDEEKNYILGLTRALAFAAKDRGGHSSGKDAGKIQPEIKGNGTR